VQTDRPPERVSRLAGVHDVRPVDGQVRFEVDGEHVDATIRELAPLGVRSIVAHPPTLEQLLLRHYGDELARGERTGVTS
jgi:polyether ionophore transport system ATP-binding protein